MDFKWAINRLKAMSVPEIVWRVKQDKLRQGERREFQTKVSVCTRLFYDDAPSHDADYAVLGLHFDNSAGSVSADIALLGGFDYAGNKRNWHAGFQSRGDWPLIPSWEISSSSPEAPGDLRTNWELNRHLQFAQLAKCYFLTCDDEYLSELTELFEDWNRNNPFLWGPEWTSPMEFAIRLINWAYCAAFLKRSDPDQRADKLVSRIEIGCKNMAGYIARHYSRYSSANNHAIVEAAALGIAGYLFDHGAWTQLAHKVLDGELLRQIHNDGVNKEQSLHYQAFSMEAVGIYLHVRNEADYEIPPTWANILANCCDYVRDCKVSEGIYLEFGDDDEGIILNLGSRKPCYPEYVLSLISLQLGQGKRWCDNVGCTETVRWLFSGSAIDAMNCMPIVPVNEDITYPDGGVTIMRSPDKRVIVGFDHGPLGLNPLAAHGHADALSVQVFIDGKPFFIDAGTSFYNGDSERRYECRSTTSHCSVNVGGRSQSEMLGPFIWGRKANSACTDRAPMRITAEHDGYRPSIHKRSVALTEEFLLIYDTFAGPAPEGATARFLMTKEAFSRTSISSEARPTDGKVVIIADTDCKLGKTRYYPRYGIEEECLSLDCMMRPTSELIVWFNEYGGGEQA